MTNEQIKALTVWLRDVAAANTKLADAISVGTTSTKLSLLIPAYFSPGSNAALWDRMIAAASTVDIVAIANPSNGPGATRSQSYTDVIGRCIAGGVKVIGYVHTGYGKRAAADVLADVDRWYSFYPTLGGIFFDQQATDAAHVDLYKTLVAEVHAHGGFCASNAGTSCDQGYLTVAKNDCLCLWERAASSGNPTLPAWAAAAPDQSFAALIHDAPAAQLTTLVKAARTAGYGRIFVTDDSWSSLGSYFDALVAAAVI